MTDYIITPHKREIPSSHVLSEELHRRALSVEMDVKGTNYKWESIHFFDPVSPETQCFAERNIHSHVYKISLPLDTTNESLEMQTALIEIILNEVGGKVFDPLTKESYDLRSFKKRSNETSSEFDFEETSGSSSRNRRSLPPPKEIAWIVFSWALVLLGFYVYGHTPQSRKLWVFLAEILALISAAGITFLAGKKK